MPPKQKKDEFRFSEVGPPTARPRSNRRRDSSALVSVEVKFNHIHHTTAHLDISQHH